MSLARTNRHVHMDRTHLGCLSVEKLLWRAHSVLNIPECRDVLATIHPGSTCSFIKEKVHSVNPSVEKLSTAQPGTNIPECGDFLATTHSVSHINLTVNVTPSNDSPKACTYTSTQHKTPVHYSLLPWTYQHYYSWIKWKMWMLRN